MHMHYRLDPWWYKTRQEASCAPSISAQFHVLKNCAHTSSIEKYSSVIPEALLSSTRVFGWKIFLHDTQIVPTKLWLSLLQISLVLGGVITSATLFENLFDSQSNFHLSVYRTTRGYTISMVCLLFWGPLPLPLLRPSAPPTFEVLCPSQLSVKHLCNHSSFTMSKWSLPVYFQIR